MYHRSLVHSAPTGRPGLRNGRCPLGRPLGLPSWPAGPPRASVLPAWASELPVQAFRTPVGRHLDIIWTPSGRQVDDKLDRQNGCHCQRTPLERQNSCQVQQNALPTVLLSPDGDICSTSIYIYIYIYIYVIEIIYIYIYDK